jgi:hypothetical protein
VGIPRIRVRIDIDIAVRYYHSVELRGYDPDQFFWDFDPIAHAVSVLCAVSATTVVCVLLVSCLLNSILMDHLSAIDHIVPRAMPVAEKGMGMDRTFYKLPVS